MDEPEVITILNSIIDGQAEILKELRKKARGSGTSAVPTLEQCLEYCAEQTSKDESWNSFDAEEFFDANSAKGWVQGKQGKPVKDWKAHMRSWKRYGYCTASKKHSPESSQVSWDAFQ